jgi:hypothetical protein
MQTQNSNIYLPVGTRVQRLSSDYLNGRQGNVVEIDEEKDRRRVAWDTEPNGKPVISSATRKPSVIRTWVHISALKSI